MCCVWGTEIHSKSDTSRYVIDKHQARHSIKCICTKYSKPSELYVVCFLKYTTHGCIFMYILIRVFCHVFYHNSVSECSFHVGGHKSLHINLLTETIYQFDDYRSSSSISTLCAAAYLSPACRDLCVRKSKKKEHPFFSIR